MTVALYRSMLDGRRGVARVHPVVLDLLHMSPWDPLLIEGTRVTGTLAAAAAYDTPQSVVLVDDLTCLNAGIEAGDRVGVARADVVSAEAVTLSRTTGILQADPEALRFALLGKVVNAGDRVSLLPQDFSRPADGPGNDAVLAALGRLSQTVGPHWQTQVLEVIEARPAGLVRVTMGTVVTAADGGATPGTASPMSEVRGKDAPAVEDLPGLERQAAALKEWWELGLRRADLLARLGTAPQMGVLITGAPGSGKAALAHAVAAALGARLNRLWAPVVARLDAGGGATELRRAFADAEAAARTQPTVLLIEDVDAVAPRDDPGPLSSVLQEELARVIKAGKLAVACTTARPETTSAELRHPGVLDHELELPLPRLDERRRILEVLCRRLPLATDVRLDEVGRRTPGFVAADLLALCRETSLRAAHRLSGAPTSDAMSVGQADFEAALEVVKPSSLEGLEVEVAGLHLDDVGDMDAVKKELTESLLWPLRYPDTFDRMGVEPPKGVLLFGPPGCGKTFIVKALANDAGANFLSVKGAELLSKWVGESERAVRELFRRARNAAPCLLFFDEVDALAPPRGSGGGDSGVSDRVVAQLLTELDGVESLVDVFVVAATNRPDLVDPALLRPGRIERLVYVPPPDGAARTAILQAATKRMPLAPDVDLVGIGASCEGYSAADLAALAREAAIGCMRESMDTRQVTGAHFAAARPRVKPSLRPDVIAPLEVFALERGSNAIHGPEATPS